MHNLYQILGVNKDASESAIKRAYRIKAKTEHPDKGGDDKRMALLTSAYETLIDNDERTKFDKEWEVYNASDDPEILVRPSGYLPTAGVAFSEDFRQKHAQFVVKANPVDIVQPNNDWDSHQNIASPYLKPFNSNIYGNAANDIFSFIKSKSDVQTKLDFHNLTPEKAMEYFLNFLKGEYSGKNLKDLCRKFFQKIKLLEPIWQVGFEFKLYCGIYEILLVAAKEKTPSSKILDSLLKITEYLENNVESKLTALLLQSKYFRCLFSQALHFYWFNEELILGDSFTVAFDGRIAAESLIERLKLRISESRIANKSNDQVVKLLRRVRVLLKLEQDLSKMVRMKKNIYDERFLIKDEREALKVKASFFREKAFKLLDWLPSLMGFADSKVIVNTLLQIGISLQRASAHEPRAKYGMADQKLASLIYDEAADIGRSATPNVELYACIHSVKFMLSCRYMDTEFKETLEGLQKRALKIADLFPFFQTLQCNADFIAEEDKHLIVMRHLLHELVGKIEDQTNPSEMDHSYVRVLYQAYEACLKNWYLENHDPKRESDLRQRLIKELLLSKNWSIDDINDNLNEPWPLSDLDNGWTCPKSSILSSAKRIGCPTYKTIRGAEFNYKTGEINFILDYCQDNELDSNRLLTPFDLKELFELRLTSGIFSLDPVDPEMPYHPFNKMWFKPSTLYNSQFLHTMFITDYLLKFLTVGKEVQRQYPFELRSLEELVSRLPEHLKKVISDVHMSNHEKSLNRFWIESEGVELAIDEVEDNVLFALGNIRMVVKHHKMRRDAEGNLVDTEGEDEGWDCYILTQEQKEELYKGIRVITDSVLIIIENSWDLIFWENSKATHCFNMKEEKQDLIGLGKLQRDSQGKVKLEGSQSFRLIYRIVLKAANKAGVPHRYSTEFVFAQEFTKYYEEFSVHFPEFGRLRELSKVIALVNVVAAQRAANQKEIELIKNRLNYKKNHGLLYESSLYEDEHSYWQTVKNKLKESVKKIVLKQFEAWRKELSAEKLREKRREVFKDLKRQIGTLKFTRNSPEIIDICDKYYFQIKEDVIKKHGYSTWNSVSHEVYNEIINPKIPQLISDMQNQKRESCVKQLLDVFEDQLNDLSSSSARRLISMFLEGDDGQLLEKLVSYDRDIYAKQIQKFYPEHSLSILDKALNNYLSAINRIVDCETEKMIEEHEKQLKEQLGGREKLEHSFANLGLGDDLEDVDLDGICPWVPASFRHDVDGSRSRLVYGGVCITGMLNSSLDENRARALIRQTTKEGKRIQESSLRGNMLNSLCEKFLTAFLSSNPRYEVKREHREDTEYGVRRVDLVVYEKDRYGNYVLGKDNRPKPLMGFEIKSAKSRYRRPDSFESEILGRKPTKQGKQDVWVEKNKGYPVHVLRFPSFSKELFKFEELIEVAKNKMKN